MEVNTQDIGYLLFMKPKDKEKGNFESYCNGNTNYTVFSSSVISSNATNIHCFSLSDNIQCNIALIEYFDGPEKSLYF
jgi:hypothetical protein